MPRFNVDFSDVGEGFKLPAEGEQICKVKSISVESGKQAKYLKWVLVIGTGPDKGAQVFHNTSFAPNALFNLRNTLIACGQDVPKAAFQVNTDLCVGKVVGITIAHKEYTDKNSGEKKKSANVVDIYRVIKGANGWKRAGGANDDILNNVPASPPEPTVDVDLDDDVDEIDI